MLKNKMGGTFFMFAPDGIPDYSQGVPEDGRTEMQSVPEGSTTVEQGKEQSVVNETKETVPAKEEGKKASSPAWMAQLPNDLKDDPILASYRTVGDLARALKEAESTTKEEAEKSQLNTEEVSEVKYENFTKRIKDDIDPYGTISEGLVEDLQKLGISQDKAEKILESVEGKTEDAFTRLIKDGIKHTEIEVKKLWGKDFDKNRALMARGYQALKDDDGSLQKRLDDEGASCSSAVWELLSRVGMLVAEDKASGSEKATAPIRDFDEPPIYPQ